MENPFISIIVVAYNSGNNIVETLESIKSQTCSNWELIISDDASNDNTVDICKKWAALNNSINCKIVTTNKNSGTSANCNRGVAEARGEWIKIIAADDILLNNFIEDNLEYIKINPEARIIQSLSNLYVDNFAGQPFQTQPSKEKHLFFYIEDGLKQYDFILNQGNYIYAPSILIHKKTLSSLGGFDERFKFMEDYPLWLKATKNDVKIHLLNKATVGYRIHGKSVMKGGKPFMSAKFAKESIYFLETFFTDAERTKKTEKEIKKYKRVVKLEEMGFNRHGLIPKILYYIVFNF